MKIPLDFYELLRNRISLSEVIKRKVSLTRKAREYVGICPFHQEKSPSFTVSDFKKFYHCFGCGAHGDVVKFISQSDGLSYKDSAIKLANDYGIELPKLTKEQELFYEEANQIHNILELAAEFFQNLHTPKTLNYLNKRDIDAEIIAQFGLGFAPGAGSLQKFFDSKSVPLINLMNAGLAGRREDGRIYEIFHERIIFPIRNVYSKVVGFGGRVLGDALPKYINSPETLVFKKGETLYGENVAISAAFKKNYIILVEGYLDVIALHKAGYSESVASLGTAVTETHLQKLWKTVDEIVICLDGDAAGIRASNKLINLTLPLISYEKKISFIILPQGEDPDDVISKNGANFFQTFIDLRINLSEMIWQNEYNSRDHSSPENKAVLEKNLATYSNLIKDKILSKNYHNFFRDKIWSNLIRRKPAMSKTLIKSEVDIAHNYTEIETLEHAFCWVLIKFPNILNNESIKESLNNLAFNNPNLTKFRDWFLEKFTTETDLQLKIIEQAVKNTGFYDTFLLLIKLDNQFFNRSFGKNTDEELIWQVLQKKYYLASLKQEYASIMQNGLENAFKKATLYQEEIIKTSNELQKLSESFSNY